MCKETIVHVFRFQWRINKAKHVSETVIVDVTILSKFHRNYNEKTLNI